MGDGVFRNTIYETFDEVSAFVREAGTLENAEFAGVNSAPEGKAEVLFVQGDRICRLVFDGVSACRFTFALRNMQMGEFLLKRTAEGEVALSMQPGLVVEAQTVALHVSARETPYKCEPVWERPALTQKPFCKAVCDTWEGMAALLAENESFHDAEVTGMGSEGEERIWVELMFCGKAYRFDFTGVSALELSVTPWQVWVWEICMEKQKDGMQVIFDSAGLCFTAQAVRVRAAAG